MPSDEALLGGRMNFNQKVYALVRQVPAGRVTTYGAVALLCGSPQASRAVGWAMAQCVQADVPCEGRLRFGNCCQPPPQHEGGRND